MCGHRASYTVLITVLLLLGVVVSVEAQRSKSDRQEQRGVTVVPAVPAPPTAERRTALVIGNCGLYGGSLSESSERCHGYGERAPDRWALPSRSCAMRISGACAMPLRPSARSCVRAWSGSSILLGMGCRSKGRITSCRLGHASPENRTSSSKQWMWGGSSAPWKMRRMASISSSWMPVVIIPLPAVFRSSQRGLAVTQAITGSLIAYATAPGSVAADGAGRNGVYTSHLLHNMRLPGVPIEQVFKNVRIGVMQETSEQADALGVLVPDRAFHV